MATVTIAQSYFEALLRKAEFHTSDQEHVPDSNLSNNVIISKAEHQRLLQGIRQYNLLKSALFRGGLTQDTLDTLLQGESNATNDDLTPTDSSVRRSKAAPEDAIRRSSNTSHGVTRSTSYDQSESYDDRRDDHIPVHDQRTVFITNLPERVTHKDIAGIIRGGRLLDIFLRHDRSASVSFVEGAAEFLAHTKRQDVYLYSKRLEFRWADRQFHVPGHVSQKIASGATRNLVVRGGAERLTAEQIRDHLEHIHNLVVVDICFRGQDVYISTNSVHNALFARTCMMSRTVYKGLRVDFCADECAAPIPAPMVRSSIAPAKELKKTPALKNIYALLDNDSDVDSDSDNDSYVTEGVTLQSHNWAEAMAA